MFALKNTVEETYYSILSVKEDAGYEEIRRSYRAAVLSHHPDKLQSTLPSDHQNEAGDKFVKVQKAWEILSNRRSRAIYDSELRASRQDLGVTEEVNLEDMMIEESGGEVLELLYQCRCGDYFSVDSSELSKMGYVLSRDENKVSIETPERIPSSVVLPCGTCSLEIRLSIDINTMVSINESQ